MKKLALGLIIFALVSCKEISYKEPQPKGKKVLTEIPKNLMGSYLISDEKGDSQDTLYVSAKGYVAASDKKQHLLGDSLVLKKFKGYYFVNIGENPEWLLRVVKQEKNGDIVYMAMDEGESTFNELVGKLSRVIKVDSIEVNDEKLYQIDPSPKQLVNLIEKGYFNKTYRMKKIK